MANQSVTDTVISTASDRSYALAFNYASQALNNSFFLAGLVCSPTLHFEHLLLNTLQAPPPPPPQSNEDPVRENTNLATAIRMNFGDIAQLKSTFSAAAMGMINNGWVWLVCDEFGSMQVVATFGSGTLLVRSRRHMSTGELPILGEPMDSVYHGAYYKKSTPQKVTPISSSLRPAHNPSSPTFGSSPTSGIDTPPTTTPPPDRSRALHYSLRRALDAVPNLLSSRDMTISGQLAAGRKERIGDILAPLLCVSVQEHAWVGTGYGIWGKEEYLKRFWSVVNWERVGRAYSLVLNSSQFR